MRLDDLWYPRRGEKINIDRDTQGRRRRTPVLLKYHSLAVALQLFQAR